MTTLFARRALLGVAPDVRWGTARVTLHGDRVTDVTELPPGSEPAPGDDDLGARALTPAFVDAHTHLALVALRGVSLEAAARGNVVQDLFFQFERSLSADDVRALTRVGAYESLLHGTALVWDHYGHGRAVAAGLVDAGVSGVVAPTLQDARPSGSEPWLPLRDDSLDATVALAAGAFPGVHAAVGPHATDTVSPALMTEIAALARRLDLPVHLHLSQAPEEVDVAVAAGRRTPLDRLDEAGLLDLRLALAHGLYLTDADLRRLDPTRHQLALCPSSQAIFGFPAAVDTWERAGARWALATDCAASNDSMNVAKEARAVAALRTAHLAAHPARAAWAAHAQVSDAHALRDARARRWQSTASLGDPRQLFARLTTVPGTLHPAFRAGAIEPGWRAHLALWNLDHPSLWPADDPLRAIVMGDATPALSQLMVDGRWRTPRDAHAAALTAEPGWFEASRVARARRDHLLAGGGA
jgi:5-methylthioadenosine/S-adenosylhomocysteine deaminase